MAEVHVTLAAEKLFDIGFLPVTNTLLTTWLVTAILIAFAFAATKKVSLVPTGLQNVAEAIVEPLQDLVSSLAGNKSKVFLPIVGSFFFFILFGNYFGLLPGIGSIGFHRDHTFIPFLRTINSDLNTTAALAIVSLLATHFLAIKYLGVTSYIAKWISLNPIMLFVGFLEIIGEFTKVVSLSFRLFGNIYAGEVVLHTATLNVFAYIVPIPFYFLELLVGFIQALIFSILTLVFMVILTEKHAEH